MAQAVRCGFTKLLPCCFKWQSTCTRCPRVRILSWLAATCKRFVWKFRVVAVVGTPFTAGCYSLPLSFERRAFSVLCLTSRSTRMTHAQSPSHFCLWPRAQTCSFTACGVCTQSQWAFLKHSSPVLFGWVKSPASDRYLAFRLRFLIATLIRSFPSCYNLWSSATSHIVFLKIQRHLGFYQLQICALPIFVFCLIINLFIKIMLLCLKSTENTGNPQKTAMHIAKCA